MSPPSLYPEVYVVTAHGRQRLEAQGDERVVDILNRYRVPWSALSIYVVPSDGGSPRLQPCLDLRLREIDDASALFAYFNRNVNPFIFSLADFQAVASADPANAATEYFYQQLDNPQSQVTNYLKRLSPGECQSAVAERVGEVVRAAVPAGSDIVVGVSGGGDSNALLHGLTQLRDHAVTVHPVIAMGIPDWDLGVPRAQELCEKYGLSLTVLTEADIKELLGIPRDSTSLIDRFEREFKGDDFEFLGTLLIRLALTRQAETIGTPWICTGLNLEDIVCEAMFRLSTGLPPAPFPVREIGDVRLVMPLWRCPKRIIDGCFPRFSLENYDARYPCFSLGRNLYYSVVYELQSQFPGFFEHFAQGLSQLSTQDPVQYTFDEQLGFHVERLVPLALRRRFQRMLGERVAVS